MGLFDKKEEREEIKEEIKNVTEIDKLITRIKRSNLENIKEELIKIIHRNYKEGLTDYKKCEYFIDLCIKYEKEVYPYKHVMIEKIYELIMNIEDTNIVYNLINMIMYSESALKYLVYMHESRAYFTDTETWGARVYEVFNHNIETDIALKEDKMRLGIYDNITDSSLLDLSIKLDGIKNEINALDKNISDNKLELDSLKTNIEETSNKTLGSIESTSKYSIKEIQDFTNDSIKKIENILNINPSSRKEILKSLDKEFHTIDAFDERVPFKERYEKLLSLKDKTKIYHPKFNDVLKYILIGNTVCLTGPSKCGKTNLVMELSKLLNLSFNNIGNIYDEIIQINGHYDFNTNYNKPVFQKTFENGGIVLIKNIDVAPIGAIYSLNNIISNFKYNPYIFGDKVLTTPNKNFRLIMTNNNGLRIDKQDIDNLVNINLDYDENYENSLSKDRELLDFLHNLRKLGLNITTSTFIDVINHLNTGLFNIEELLINYIIENNSSDLLKRKSEEISNDNKYNNTLKKLLKG